MEPTFAQPGPPPLAKQKPRQGLQFHYPLVRFVGSLVLETAFQRPGQHCVCGREPGWRSLRGQHQSLTFLYTFMILPFFVRIEI